MVLFCPGKTECSICGKTIDDVHDLVGFPAFIGPNHPLHEYSDSAFHKNCFEQWTQKDELQSLYERYRQIWDSRPDGLKSLEEINEWGKEAFKDFD